MTRAPLTYATAGARRAPSQGYDVTTPTPGYYRFRLRSGGITGGVRIWHGPPHDPVTGEELDRGWRWQAEFDGEPVDFDRVWPACADAAITEAEYRGLVARREWARTNAPGSAFANPRKRYDPLDTATPLPF